MAEALPIFSDILHNNHLRQVRWGHAKRAQCRILTLRVGDHILLMVQWRFQCTGTSIAATIQKDSLDTRIYAKRAQCRILTLRGRRPHSSDGTVALPMHWYEHSCYDPERSLDTHIDARKIDNLGLVCTIKKISPGDPVLSINHWLALLKASWPLASPAFHVSYETRHSIVDTADT